MSHPPLPPAELAPDIETASQGYAGRFAGPVGAWFLERQAQSVLELMAPWPGARVLELGGGHAQLAPHLIQAGHSVTVHGSHPVCQKRLARLMAPGSYEFVEAPLTALPLADRSFDVVLGVRLMAHAADWRALLAEMARLADKAVILDYPDLMSCNLISQRLFAAKQAVEKNTRPFTCFRRDEVAEALAGHSLGRVSARPQFFLPMALHRALGMAGLSKGLEAGARGLGLVRLLGSPVILRAARQEALA